MEALLMLSDAASSLTKRKVKKTAPDFRIVFQPKTEEAPGMTLEVWFRWKKVRSVGKVTAKIKNDLHFVTYANYGEVGLAKILTPLIGAKATMIPESMIHDAKEKNEASLKEYFHRIWQQKIKEHPIDELKRVYENIAEKVKNLNNADDIKRRKKQKGSYTTINMECRQALNGIIEEIVRQVGDTACGYASA
jgi:hypothetical protein